MKHVVKTETQESDRPTQLLKIHLKMWEMFFASSFFQEQRRSGNQTLENVHCPGLPARHTKCDFVVFIVIYHFLQYHYQQRWLQYA